MVVWWHKCLRSKCIKIIDFIKKCNNINTLKGKSNWLDIRKLSKFKSNLITSPEIIYNNTTHCISQDKSNVFADYYNRLFKSKDYLNFDADHFNLDWYNDHFTPNNTTNYLLIITEEEYSEVLARDITTNKNILRQLAGDVHKEIQKMYNFCLQRSYKASWKQGMTTTIPKAGQYYSSP